MLERAFYRGGGALAQAAQTGALDFLAQHFEGFNIAVATFSLAYTGQYFEDTFGAHPAWGAFTAAFILGKFHKEAGDVYHAGVFIHHHHTA